MSNESGLLYVVATPIGNLDDISTRARQILGEVDLIAAEDTRHSKKLLSHLGLSTSMQAYHDHNERSMAPRLVEKLLAGNNLALISDAGTPLLNDPGFHLVKLAHQNRIRVIPVPGPSALVSALSVAGLGTEGFIFDGFLPEKQRARRTHLESLQSETRTLAFYEAPHRIRACLQDCLEVFGAQRRACIAREISKRYETVRTESLSALLEWLDGDAQQLKGEFVLLIEGCREKSVPDNSEGKRVLEILLGKMSVSDAAAMAAEISGLKKNELYKLALEIKGDG